MPIDASHALARMAWVAGHQPAVWAATAHVLAPKDFVLARLTGAVAADPIAAVGLAGGDLRYVEPLIGRVEGAPRAAGAACRPAGGGGAGARRACPAPACR